jgi:hypothetical protein
MSRLAETNIQPSVIRERHVAGRLIADSVSGGGGLLE